MAVKHKLKGGGGRGGERERKREREPATCKSLGRTFPVGGVGYAKGMACYHQEWAMHHSQAPIKEDAIGHEPQAEPPRQAFPQHISSEFAWKHKMPQVKMQIYAKD